MDRVHELVAPGEAAGTKEGGGKALLLALEHGHVLLGYAPPALVIARGICGKARQRRGRLGETAAEREEGALGGATSSTRPAKSQWRRWMCAISQAKKCGEA